MLGLLRILLPLAIGLPALLFVAFALYTQEERLQTARGLVVQTTAILHEHTLRVLELNEVTLDRLVKFHGEANVADASVQELAERELQRVRRSAPSLESIGLMDARGVPIARSGPRQATQAISYADRDFFRHHRDVQDDQPFVSLPHVGRISGERQFVLSRRIEEEGRFDGVVAAGISSRYFKEQWALLAPELDSAAALVRQDGHILVRHPQLALDVPPLPPDSDFMRAVAGAEQGLIEGPSAMDGVVRITGYRKVRGYPLYLAYSVSRPAVLAQWRRSVALYGVLCGFAAAGLAWLALLLGARARNEQRLLQQLESTNASRSRFFANVSHELRTPLTLVLGPVGTLLAEPGLGADQRRQLQVVQRNARVLLRRVNDLLDIARIEAGALRMHYVRADLAQAVRFACSHFDSLARERSMSLECLAPEHLAAEVDLPRVERVLFNLLSNAFRFAPDGSRIRVELRQDGSQAWLEVADGGPGVPPHQREAVFARFGQADTRPWRAAGGSGLGLAIVKEFVEVHGGSVAISDAPEGGALFTLRLPLRAPEDTPVADIAAGDMPGLSAAGPLQPDLPPQRSSPPPPPGLGQPHVLVVEDHPEMADYIVDALGPGMRVSRSGNGREGLACARRDPPDLVVTDVVMPSMSGTEFIGELRRDPQLQTFPCCC